MGICVRLLCEPEPKRRSAESDVKAVVYAVEWLDALARKCGVRPLGEFGLGEDYEDADWDELFDPKEAIRTINALLPVLRQPPRGRKAGEHDFGGSRAITIAEELDELLRRLKRVARGKTRFRFLSVP